MARKCKANENAIVNGWLYFEDVPQAEIGTDLCAEILEEKTLNTIRLVSLAANWTNQQYLWETGVTLEKNINFEMTLRKEVRSGKFYWYAYRRYGGKLYKRFVGYSENITSEKLAEIASKMPGATVVKAASND